MHTIQRPRETVCNACSLYDITLTGHSDIIPKGLVIHITYRLSLPSHNAMKFCKTMTERNKMTSRETMVSGDTVTLRDTMSSRDTVTSRDTATSIEEHCDLTWHLDITCQSNVRRHRNPTSWRHATAHWDIAWQCGVRVSQRGLMTRWRHETRRRHVMLYRQCHFDVASRHSTRLRGISGHTETDIVKSRQVTSCHR